jgi:hypothetical protein
MLSLLAADDADRPAWKRVSDRLAYGESGQYSLEDMPDTVRRVGVPAGTTQDVAPTMVLLPHQERIAVLALKATEDLRGRTKKQLRHAGIVLQALGTGMTMSLLGYFRLNSELPERRRTRRHVVIVDRLELGKQIVDSYRRFVRPAEPPIVMLATAAELNTELAGDAPIVIVTTTQKLQQLTGINAECIIFFGLRSVTPALMARFKSGTTLIFSYEAALVESRFVRDYGPLVASYAFGDAVEEGNLVPVALRRENVGILPGPVQLNMVRKIVSIIAGRTRRANAKAVVIVEDAASAALLRDAIQHAKVKHCALAAGSMAPARLRQTIVEFNRLEGEAAVLVTTPSIAVGLYLNGIDVCYLTTRVPTAAMFRLESFVSRIRPGKRHGEIVDMADNDWASVDEARRIVRGYPYGLS